MLKNTPIRKLVIPLAGFGTRFLPVSKNYPKEMINLVDRPVIQYLVEEARDSGITEIIFVLNYSKDVIAEYFSSYQHPHQRKAYRNSMAATENLKELQVLLKSIRFHHIKKSVTLGDGHSISFAKSKIKPNEPFAVTMGDLLSPPGKPFLKQLIDVYHKVHAPVISVEQVPRKEVFKYGVIAPEKTNGRLHRVKDLVEKPNPKDAPSNLILTGKYILTFNIFSYLENLRREHSSEKGDLRLADALKAYAKDHDLYAYECVGNIQDTGNKFDFLKATVYFGLSHPKFGKEFKKFITSLKL
ncbi:MAG: UTP--glucose-1-phosphate uridylyltransferase [Patescibacteria group bacterium]